MAIHEKRHTDEDRHAATADGPSHASGAQEAAARALAPYTPPHLEPLGAWVLTLQQTSPPII